MMALLPHNMRVHNVILTHSLLKIAFRFLVLVVEALKAWNSVLNELARLPVMHKLSMHTVIHTAVDIVMHWNGMSVDLLTFGFRNMHLNRWIQLRQMLFLDLLLLMLGLVLLQWLHLDDHVPIFNIDVLRIEDTAIRLERATSLMPASMIKSVEVVSPVEIELAIRGIVVVDLDPIVEDIPRHVSRV